MSFYNSLQSCTAFCICSSCISFYYLKAASCLSVYSCLFCMLSVIIRYSSTLALLSSSYQLILLNYLDFSFNYLWLSSALLSKSLSLEFISSCSHRWRYNISSQWFIYAYFLFLYSWLMSLSSYINFSNLPSQNCSISTYIFNRSIYISCYITFSFSSLRRILSSSIYFILRKFYPYCLRQFQLSLLAQDQTIFMFSYTCLVFLMLTQANCSKYSIF